MAGMSNYLKNQILGWVKSTAFASDPAAVYLAVFDGDPTDTGASGDEIGGDITGAAARIAITFGAVAGNSTITNTAAVEFGASVAGGSIDVTHVAIFDAVSAGNMLFSAELSVARVVSPGAALTFAIGDVTVVLD